jgi:molybdopterin-containing oxidoreductase family iron-sulfur binding subunit
MAIKRRDFLKILGVGGISTIGVAGIGSLYSRAEVEVVPHTPPQGALKAKRWGMVIDVKKCLDTGEECIKNCEAIQACHLTHNVPNIPDKKKEIKWIWIDNFEHAFPDLKDQKIVEHLSRFPFFLLCNHCENPPCVRVCPTKATFKRSDGIVMMDFHRCIGCRFCMAGCPYGSRSFNWIDPRPYLTKVNPEFPTRKPGVVEKCLFCYERLDEGKIPACVEACKSQALIFGDLNDPESEINKILKERVSLTRKPELGTNPSVFYVI